MTSLSLTLLLFNIISANLITNSSHAQLLANQTVARGAVVLPQSTQYEVFCSVNSSYHKSIDYILFYRGENLISNRFVTMLDSTKVRIYVHSEIQPNERFFARFFMNSESVLGELSCANATVTPKPHHVENFACISNALENMTCTWLAFNDVPTIYKVYYSPVMESTPRQMFHCPRNRPSNYNCTWTRDSNPPYLSDIEFLEFTVHGENAYGTSTQNFTIHHHAIIVPPPPYVFMFVDRTSSSVLLKWKILHRYLNFEPGWLYYVSYTFPATTYSFSKIYHQRELLVLDNEIWLNVTNLPYPNTEYTFQVFMKTPMATDDYWSMPATTKVRTNSCAPYQAPVTMTGGFQLVNVTGRNRIVAIYWWPVPQTEQNGDDFYYEVTVFRGNEALEVISLQASEHSFRHAISFEAHRFVIRSGNQEGVSQTSSEVHVPAQADLVNPTDVLLFAEVRGANNNSSELIWQAFADVNNFTIFRCKTQEILCKEVSEVYYASKNVTKFEVSSYPGHRLAISINSPKSTSGLLMPSCYIHRDQIGIVKQLQAVRVGPYDIVISWTTECLRETPLFDIRSYIIHYCLSENDVCVEPALSVSHRKLENLQTILPDLRPFSLYRISVSALLEDGLGSRSEYFYQHTLEGAPDLDGFEFGAKNTSSSWIQLQWSPPKRMNGVFQHYLVSYNKKSIIVHDNQVMLTNLKSNTNYSIQIYACTSKCSAPIGPKIIRTKGNVGRMENIKSQRLNSTHIRLSWDSSKKAANYERRMHIQFGDENATLATSDNEVVLPSAGSRGDENSVLISVAAV